MIVRPAKPIDRPALKELWNLGHREFDGAPDLLSDGTFEELLERMEHGWVLVAETGGTVVGMVSFSISGDRYLGMNVAVLPAYRRRGVGQELINGAHMAARELGATTATAVYWNGHPYLEKFYASVGYQPAAQLLVKDLR